MPARFLNMPSTLKWLTLSILLAGCLLVEEEDNFIEVPQVPDLNNWNDVSYSYDGKANNYVQLVDTLYLEDKVHIRIDQENLFAFRISIDNEVVLDAEPASIDFQLLRGSIAAGIHELTIVQRVRSGTNSLADKVGAEYIEIEANYLLDAGTISFTPTISSITIANGTLNIQWNKYALGDFTAYELVKVRNTGSNNVFTITNQNTTTYQDIAYAGGLQEYHLELNRAGKKLSSAASTIDYNFASKIEIEKLSNNQARIRLLEKPLTINNLSSYSIYMGSTLLKDKIPPATFEFHDFTAVLTFGELIGYHFNLFSKAEFPQSPSTDIYISPTIQASYGERVPQFVNLIYKPSRSAYYLNSAGKTVYKMNPDTYALLDSVQVDAATGTEMSRLIMSENGDELYFMKEASIKKINPAVLSSVTTLTLTDFGLPAGATLDDPRYDNFGAGNNGTILFKVKNGQVIVADAGTMTQLAAMNKLGPTQLSADGVFFVNGNELYKWNGTTYSLQSTLSYPTIVYSRFLHSIPGFLFIVTGTAWIIYDCNNDTVSQSSTLSTSTNPLVLQPQLDLSSDKFLMRVSLSSSTEQYLVIDLFNSAASKSLALHFSTLFALEGNQLFSANGHVTKTF